VAATPLHFERNDGQGPSGVHFMARGAGYSVLGNASIGMGGNSGEGGGGGGGGAGYIRSNVMLTGATTSPAADVVP